MMNEKEWLGEKNELGLKIWNEKYRYKGESFSEFIKRVSSGDKEMADMLVNKDFLFGGRILANLNTGSKQGISNCVTVGYVEDNLDSIMDTAKDIAMSFKKEAGVGVCFSKVRPKGAKIGEFGVSDGVIGFMKIFSEIADNISRGGARRGAILMGLHADHPDVMEFIKIKKNNTGSTGEIKSANLSVLVTDEFMRCYLDCRYGTGNGKYRKDFVVESTGEVIPHVVDTVKIMDAIIDKPEKAFEPGILFVDRFTEGHLFGKLYNEYEMFTNACSEFYGTDGTVCLLGSMNVANFVKYGAFDRFRFEKCVRTAIRHMDQAHDYGIGRNGVQIQNDKAEDYRGLGLGIMGLADLFINLKIKYGSEESIKLAREVTRIMRVSAIKESQELALQYGIPEGIMELYEKADDLEVKLPVSKLRNNSLISIAPAGTIATMLGISTGIEPVFRAEYVRTKENRVTGEKEDFIVRHKAIDDYMTRMHYDKLPAHCIDSTQVDPIDKIKILAAIQEYTDLSISNTTNFPKGTCVDEIKDMYIEAWKLNVKGVTCYVDKSLDGVLNEVPKENKEKDKILEKRVKQESEGVNPKVDIPIEEMESC